MRTLATARRISLCEHTCVGSVELDRTDAVFSPGWVHTGLTARQGGPKPAGAWTPEQTVEYMAMRGERGVSCLTVQPWCYDLPCLFVHQGMADLLEPVYEQGDFYVICPDNETTPVRPATSKRVQTDVYGS